MNSITFYILRMLPFMLLIVPPFILIRYFIVRNKKIKISWHHEIGLLIFVMFLVGLASLTVIPRFDIGVNGNIIVNITDKGSINLIPLKVITETYFEVFKNDNFKYFLINFLGNIVMFMPIGFMIALLYKKIKFYNIIEIGFLISLFIEISQIFINRGTDVDDLILNTLGCFLGLILYKIVNKYFNKWTSKFKY